LKPRYEQACSALQSACHSVRELRGSRAEQTCSAASACPGNPEFCPGFLCPAPSLDEVRDYARSRNSAVNPERFYDYYASTEWRRGKTRITNWKAAFRCWESREKDMSRFDAGTAGRVNPAAQYSQRDYSGMEESMDELMDRLLKGA